MKRLAVAAAAVVALTCAAGALAASGPIGKYQTTIKTAGQFKGTWILYFSGGRNYAVVQNNKTLIRGISTASGSKITFGHESGPAACPKSGTYTFKVTGKTLKLTRIADAGCVGRSTVLAHTFTLITGG